MSGPGLSDEATQGDDGVGEVEEGVDDDRSPFVATLQPVEAVVPRVGALHMPALPGLDRCLLAFVSDLAVQASCGQFLGSLTGVVAGIEVHGDVLRQRTYIVQHAPGGV